MKRILGGLWALAGLIGLVALSDSATAQNYPTRPITLVCTFPAGTGADIYVRYFVEPLQKRLGQSVIVENKGGAQGNIGTEFAARQKPDGYTILIAPGSSTMAAAQSTFKQLPFNPEKDFEPVAMLVKLGFVLSVDAKSPHKTLAELTEAVKKKGASGKYGSGSNTGLVTAELYKAAYDLKTVEVRYTDAMTGLNDLLGGQLDFYSMDSAFAKGQVASGKIRALVQTTTSRATGFEDVPTVGELKIPGFEKMEPWWAAYVPAKTPKAVIDKLEATFADIVKQPEFKEFFNKIGGEPYPGNRDLVAKLQKEETEAWKRYVKLAKIEPM
jgi:tripartite-type tricarboxylate transporter receptor subunit TctC